MIKSHSSSLRGTNGFLFGRSAQHRRDIFQYLWRGDLSLFLIGRCEAMLASISKDRPSSSSSTFELNAYGSRKLTTPKGQPAFRRVTKGYLPRGGRGCVKRRPSSLPPSPQPPPRRAPAVGTKWNSIFDYAGFAYFPPRFGSSNDCQRINTGLP